MKVERLFWGLRAAGPGRRREPPGGGAFWECMNGPGVWGVALSAPPAPHFHCHPRSLVFSLKAGLWVILLSPKVTIPSCASCPFLQKCIIQGVDFLQGWRGFLPQGHHL